MGRTKCKCSISSSLIRMSKRDLQELPRPHISGLCLSDFFHAETRSLFVPGQGFFACGVGEGGGGGRSRRRSRRSRLRVVKILVAGGGEKGKQVEKCPRQ